MKFSKIKSANPQPRILKISMAYSQAEVPPWEGAQEYIIYTLSSGTVRDAQGNEMTLSLRTGSSSYSSVIVPPSPEVLIKLEKEWKFFYDKATIDITVTEDRKYYLQTSTPSGIADILGKTTYYDSNLKVYKAYSDIIFDAKYSIQEKEFTSLEDLFIALNFHFDKIRAPREVMIFTQDYDFCIIVPKSEAVREIINILYESDYS